MYHTRLSSCLSCMRDDVQIMSDVLLYPCFLLFLPETVPSSPEDKWVVIVDRASLLLIQALSGLQRLQEQSWRLLELHSLKIVSTGIIWVSLQEVGCLIQIVKEQSLDIGLLSAGLIVIKLVYFSLSTPFLNARSGGKINQ